MPLLLLDFNIEMYISGYVSAQSKTGLSGGGCPILNFEWRWRVTIA
jgi:hypothetical protein